MSADPLASFSMDNAPPTAKWLGMEVLSWDRDAMTLRLAFNPPRDVINFGGVVQGGFLIAMMDDAMGFNCFISLGMVNRQASIDVHTHFLRAVQHGRVEVEARVVRAGRSVAFLEAELYGPDGELAARSASSMKLTPIAKAAQAAE